MLTEQKPPWAAWLGVPNWLAHQPVSDWLWSRPVKKASLRGSERTHRRRATRRPGSSASSHSISLKFACDPRSTDCAATACCSSRGRVMLHDAGGALGAKHAFVNRVVRVALDVAQIAVLQVDFDPAPAGAHVAGGGLDLVADGAAEVDMGLGSHASLPSTVALVPTCSLVPILCMAYAASPNTRAAFPPRIIALSASSSGRSSTCSEPLPMNGSSVPQSSRSGPTMLWASISDGAAKAQVS